MNADLTEYRPAGERGPLPEAADVDAEAGQGRRDHTIPGSWNRSTRIVVLAVLAFAVAVILTLTAVFVVGDDGGELEATRMTLNLAYPTSGEPTARVTGQPGAAPAGSTIGCRSTADQLKLGNGTANDDGSFDIALDPSAWPLDRLTGDAYKTLNTTLECRAGDGPWVQPLRPPHVAIQ